VEFQADATIVGAGVIGLSIAAQVASQDRGVCVLERNETFGLEISSRNSEVIHSGLYYPQDSLKAKMCVEGKNLLYELCQKQAIAHQRLGKLIVATNHKEAEKLETLLKNGERNGLTDLKMLSKQEVKTLEPHVKTVGALLCPSTGIVDSHGLMKHYVRKAKEKGALISYNSKVVGIEKISDGYKVTIEEPGDTFSFLTRVLINCAGLNSDQIAKLADIDILKAGYKLYFCKGEYFSVGHGKGSLVQRLIYPVPPDEGGGLGIHVTLDLQGRMRLGPNARYVDQIDHTVDSSQRRAFYEAVVRFLPFIEYDDLEPDLAGIRPKLEDPQGNFRDFVIRHEYDKGLPGLINLIGIESPGLTACPAIAKYVADMVDEMGL
jgi:L-2-hydroxyglutarate oxidase LhgO